MFEYDLITSIISNIYIDKYHKYQYNVDNIDANDVSYDDNSDDNDNDIFII